MRLLRLLDRAAGVTVSGQHVPRLISAVKKLLFPFKAVLCGTSVVARLNHPAELNLIQVNQCFSLLSPLPVAHPCLRDLVKQCAHF